MSSPSSSPSPSPLPAGWMKILDEVHMRLDHAIAATNARMHEVPAHESANLVQARHQEVARWHERLHRLNAYLESAEQVVQSVDEILQDEETRLRKHLATSGTLKQRLAEGAGGAIGYTA
jgi:hypothetical protein